MSPTLSGAVGCAAGALVAFVLTYLRWWRQRRRLARQAARRLAPRLKALDTEVADGLAAYSWRPVVSLDLTDHSVPALTMAVMKGLPVHSADPFIDGVLAVHELDRARVSTSLAAPHERDRIESYRRRIGAACVIASSLASGMRSDS